MQYAQVVPDTKTDPPANGKNSIFTYKITPEQLPIIKIGSLVKIPFRNKKINGIILKIKRTKPASVDIDKLKKIDQVLYSKNFITREQLKLAQWISKYYHSPLSTVLFSIIPIPPLKKTKKIELKIKNPNLSQNDLLFKLKFQNFRQMINKNLKQKKKTIILFPQIKLAQIFYYYFEKIYHQKVILYHSGLNKNQKWQNYQKILKNSAQIIIGSQIAIFSPVKNLGQIIIDSADNMSFKQDREPRFDARRVAQNITQSSGAKASFLTPAPPLEFTKSIKNKGIAWINYKSPFEPKIQIIDLQQEYLRKNFNLIAEEAQKQIMTNYQAKKQSVLFINKKGSASVIICQDCNNVIKCPKCDNPLTYRLKHLQYSQILMCHYCNFQDQLFSKCPKCQGINFKFLGGGTEKLETEIKKLLPKASILRIEKNIPLNKNQDYDIVIATQKMFLNYFKPVDLVIAVQPDLELNLPDFKASEKTFQNLKNLKLYAKKQFIIQTHYPKHYLFQSILKKIDSIFYKKELNNRKRENYPPYGKLITITISDKNEKKAYQLVTKLIDKLNHKNIEVDILGPTPIDSITKETKFIWQIILKGKNPEILLPDIPKGWKINVDPVILL